MLWLAIQLVPSGIWAPRSDTGAVQVHGAAAWKNPSPPPHRIPAKWAARRDPAVLQDGVSHAMASDPAIVWLADHSQPCYGWLAE